MRIEKIVHSELVCPRYMLCCWHQAPRAHDMRSQPMTPKWKKCAWLALPPVTQEWRNEQRELVLAPLHLVVSTPPPPEHMAWAPSQWHRNVEDVDCELVLPPVHLVVSTPLPQNAWHERPTNDSVMEKMCIVSWFCPGFTWCFRHQAPRAHDMSS